MLSQHYFQIYGADKEEIENALNELQKKKLIHHHTYKGLVGYAEAEFKPIEYSDVAINLDINKYYNNMISQLGIPSSLLNYNVTNAIGHDINQPLDKRGVRKI